MPTPGGLYVPEEHSVGDIGSEPFIHDRPAGQMRQDDALPRLYLPSGHLLHVTCPDILYSPAEHGTGALDGFKQECPASHALQLTALVSLE